LFLFAPVTVLGLAAFPSTWRRDRATALLLGGTVVVLTLFYASQLYWDADRSYGPRYLVAILPFLCLPLTSWFDLPPRSMRHRVLSVVSSSACLRRRPVCSWTSPRPATGPSTPPRLPTPALDVLAFGRRDVGLER